MIFSLRPVFIGWATIISLLPLQLFSAAWAGIFFGILIQWLQVRSRVPWFPYAAPAAVMFFGIFVLGFFGKRLNYNRTECRFYDDRLEFEEGFFAVNRKTIRFRDVKEMTLHKGILQRLCGLGTIYLGTVATGAMSISNPFASLGLVNASASGILLRDIPDPDAAFEKIREVVKT
jgi:membrane protein YdbS with pleckstrin-like domain